MKLDTTSCNRRHFPVQYTATYTVRGSEEVR